MPEVRYAVSGAADQSGQDVPGLCAGWEAVTTVALTVALCLHQEPCPDRTGNDSGGGDATNIR